jgi:hypothetical protein
MDCVRVRIGLARMTEMKVAVHMLNHMLTLGQPSYVQIS